MSKAVLDASIRDWRNQDQKQLQCALVTEIWTLPTTMREQYAALYLDHYYHLSNSLDYATVAPKSHQDAIDIVNIIRTQPLQTKQEMRQALQAKSPQWLKDHSAEAIDSALGYAVSLWLMVQPDGWRNDQSIIDFAAAKFPRASTRASNVKLTFDALSLRRIAKIRIVWTSNLDEHLELNSRTSALYLFSHASFLATRHDRSPCSIYPSGFLQETEKTIALLFPSSDTQQRTWIRRNRRLAEIDVEPGLARRVPRSLSEYDYWFQRLEHLQSHFDGTTPRSLSQWFHDRRDGNSFFTFWLAVAAITLTLLFGLTQSLTGLLQLILR
ncbi:hypothetical protein FH972_024217 [Carpinus fangiana]|uniref:Uncharacterized protein n=1 Tax=Carpinus fangiana TaxID=176857 RepID=A0A5N6KXE8_9ROSI|nr:hypothetical protein FH972_024217 [Carpinus fangiana]